MRILVTRAREDAARTVAQLAALGHEVLEAPVLEIVPTGANAPAGSFDAVAISSAHALGVLDPAALRGLFAAKLFAVGARTAEIAAQIGFAGPIVTAEDAAALARSIMNAAPRNLLYLAGRARKATLEQALAAAGISLHIWETYDACAARTLPAGVSEALRQGQIDAVLHYSRRSAEILVALMLAAGLQDALTEVHHHCLSADIAEVFAPLGAKKVHFAAMPTERALFATLL
jgi:uroporphyrinogen-III synthase